MSTRRGRSATRLPTSRARWRRWSLVEARSFAPADTGTTVTWQWTIHSRIGAGRAGVVGVRRQDGGLRARCLRAQLYWWAERRCRLRLLGVMCRLLACT